MVDFSVALVGSGVRLSQFKSCLHHVLVYDPGKLFSLTLVSSTKWEKSENK